MQIAVRNLGGATYAGNGFMAIEKQRAAWVNLAATGADVLLAQEARLFDRRLPLPEAYTSTALAADSMWGSVVAVRQVESCMDWRPDHPVVDAFGDYVASILITVGHRSVAVVSVHAPTSWYPGLWESTGGTGPAPNGMGRPWPSDVLLDALIEALAGRDDVIVGGDFNEAVNYPADGDAGTTSWFKRAKDATWVELVATTFGGPVRTNFTRQAKRSYQNDHVFVSEALAAQATRVTVWNEPGQAVSDHAGIVVELEI